MKSFLFWVCLMAMGFDPCLAQITATVSLGNTLGENTALDSTDSGVGLSRTDPTTLRSPVGGSAKDDTPDSQNSNITTSSMPVLSLSWPRVRPQTQPRNDECVPYAASFHQVSDSILRAILLVESGMNPNTINKNANGSIDLGLGGMNSVHFQELAKFGIAPVHLLNACVATYVTAWQLKKQFTQYGVTWFAIGAYHSITPYFNQRYQILIYNQLLKIHALQGTPLPVPPMTPKPG